MLINSSLTNFNSDNRYRVNFGFAQGVNKNLSIAIKKTGNKIDYDSVDVKKIKSMLKKGFSLNDIANAINEKMSTVRSILAHFGLKTSQGSIIAKIDEAKLREMVAMGLSQKEIAKAFNIKNTAALTPLLKKLGLNPTQSKVSSITKFEIETLLMMNKSVEEIAEHFSVAPRYISQRIKELGLKTHLMEAQNREFPQQQIIDCLEMGLTKQEIVKRCKVSMPKLTRFMKEAGLKTKYELEVGVQPEVSIDELKKLLQIHRTKTDIAKALNISISKLTTILDKHNLQVNKYLPPTKEELLSVFDAAKKGINQDKKYFEVTMSKRSQGQNYICNIVCDKYKITPKEFKKLIEKYELAEQFKDGVSGFEKLYMRLLKRY